MMQGVQNPEIIYRSAALPEPMRERLRELGYAPFVTELLMNGLPIVYSEDGLVVEYPDGHRIHAERHDGLDDSGVFRWYRYEVVERLNPAARQEKRGTRMPASLPGLADYFEQLRLMVDLG